MSLCTIPTATLCYTLCIDLVLIISVADEDLNPVDLTNTIVELAFVLRGDDSEFTFSSDVGGDGLSITDAVNGEITLSLTPIEAAAIFVEGNYDAKLFITDSLDVKDNFLDIFFQVDRFLAA